MIITFIALFLLVWPSSIFANDSEEWEVMDPRVARHDLEFETTEGTWISLDVHPDGDTVVFDLAGEIYRVPLKGGDATLLAGGIPWEIQPRYSPDGTQILFTSDRGGGDNLWVMNADGSDARAVTEESFRLFNNGAWHPNGEYVVGKKHFTSRRSLGAGEMWMVRLDGGGSGIGLTEKRNEQMDENEPTFSPDGRYLYWAQDMSPGSSFQYNKDVHGTIFVIRRLELETGEITDLIRIPGGAVRPEASPDGKTLAFVHRDGLKTILMLYDFESGRMRTLWHGLSEDQQETWTLFGVHPGFDWTPDGKEIVISAKGKLWRVSVATGEPTPIPFRAAVNLSVADALRVSQEIGSETFPVKVIRWPQTTSRGRTIFQALGNLYRWDEGQESPAPLFTNHHEFRFAPQLSQDEKRIAYVTWNDREGGFVKTVGVDGRGERTIVSRPGHYVTASFSPDGKSLVYERGGGDVYRGRIWDEDPGIYVVDATGRGEPRLVTRDGSAPRFDKSGKRIYLYMEAEEESQLVSVNLLGSDPRVHASSVNAWDFVLSPDEQYLAFEELWNTYVVPFPLHAGTIEVSPSMGSLPVKKLSQDGGTYLSWSRDSKTVRWSLGPKLFTAELDSVFAPNSDADGEEEDDTPS